MCEIEGNIKTLLPESEKTGKNVGPGVAGALLIVSWFLWISQKLKRSKSMLIGLVIITWHAFIMISTVAAKKMKLLLLSRNLRNKGAPAPLNYLEATN
jgi:hypothetical protein